MIKLLPRYNLQKVKISYQATRSKQAYTKNRDPNLTDFLPNFKFVCFTRKIYLDKEALSFIWKEIALKLSNTQFAESDI
jgi:hypothetical protein